MFAAGETIATARHETRPLAVRRCEAGRLRVAKKA
jgi:hypothetical protein